MLTGSQVPGTKLEKRMVLKLDLILLPVLWWMYILAYVDRGNVVSIHPLSEDISRPGI